MNKSQRRVISRPDGENMHFSFSAFLMLTIIIAFSAITQNVSAATSVAIKLIRNGDLTEMIPFSGEIRPFEESHVTPDVGGRVDKILVENGKSVKAGEPMIVLEHARLDLAVQQSEIGVKRAEQEVKNKTKDFDRRRILLEKKVLNEKAYDESETDFIQANNSLKSAQQTLVLDKLNLERATIRAQITGVFVNRNVFLGQSVQPGMLLGKVVALNKIYVEAKIPENRINRVKIDQLCRLESGAHGHVAFINVYGDESRSFLIRILVDNTDGTLKPNMFVKGDLTAGQYSGVPIVPVSAVAGTADRPAVFIVENGKAVEKPIEIVARQAEFACVKGVEAGQQLVVVGVSAVADGADVTVVEQAESPAAASGTTTTLAPTPSAPAASETPAVKAESASGAASR
ncbi:MAG: efflux RND transporter periplasmic adaptor subunit [Candidatus Riflebacteria bacterium]|nr:efflux RND transporter periplasmic adaptor subunit [Candidatus Riflebacteria bacterium]